MSREDNPSRYAYPVYFAFVFFPLAVLPFQAAQRIALAAGIAATTVSLFFWLPEVKRSRLYLCIATLFAVASYPVMLAFQLRQPTIMIAALLACTFFCMRSGHLLAAGVLAGLTLAKPHIAAPVLLPLVMWSLAEWRTKKSFLLSLVATFTGLLAAAEAAVPGWIPHWVGTLEAYARYTGANPPLLDALPRCLYLPVCGLLVAAIIRVSLNSRLRDPLFAVAFSTAAFELMLPFQIYNELLLLPATLWILAHKDEIQNKGQIRGLLWWSSLALLGAGWTSQVALTVGDLAFPGSGVKLWQVPLTAIWLYPWPLFLTLGACAATSAIAFADDHAQPFLTSAGTWLGFTPSKSAIPQDGA